MSLRLEILAAVMLVSCSPKVVSQVERVVEYKDRIVRDTATFFLEKEVERIVTKDTASHLENSYAKSDAIVSGGLLQHSLESKPQYIKVPVEVHVTDTLWRESIIREKQPISKSERFRIDAFWWIIALCIIGFRREILSIVKKLK